jgi:hypothetical protein
VSDYEFTMALRIRHPSIEPAEITRTLGIEPQHTWRAGEVRRGPEGQVLEGLYRESYWTGRLMDEPQLSADQVSVESVVLRTLAQLRKSFQFLAGLNADGGVVELHVSIFARNDFRLEFLPESLALLGRLGLSFAFEVQPHPNRAAAALRT